MKNVTGVVVFCCTPNLIDVSIKSFREFYPKMRLIIVNNSFDERQEGLNCTKALEEYCKTDENVELHTLPVNIGHGLGMHHGIEQVKTKYIYMFESDTLHQKPNLIEDMLKVATNVAYAVGPTVIVDYEYCKYSATGVRRLWPYASLINRKKYYKFPMFSSDKGVNAAPLLKVTQAIADSGIQDKLLIEFPVNLYVKHLDGGTRGVIGIPELKDHKKWTYHYSKSI